MTDLTDRQIQILKAVVEEYSNTAEPVGSETMDKKYSLGVSPATIRNEMSYLTTQGYLAQPHTSAGRIPTALTIKLYIREIMREQEMSVAEEVSAKEKVWDKRHQFAQLLSEASHELSRRTNSIGVAITDEGSIYTSGYAHILDMPEFYDIDVTRSLFSLLDEASKLMSLFEKADGLGEIKVLVGDDFGNQFLMPVGCVLTRFEAKEGSGTLGVIGSHRFNYPRVIPMVRHFGNLVGQIG